MNELIIVTEKRWFEIGDGFKGMTPLTVRRQVAEECLVEGGSRRMLTEGVHFYVDDEEGRKYADPNNN